MCASVTACEHLLLGLGRWALIPVVGKEIDGAQIRKVHGLGFPSRPEVGFAHVVKSYRSCGSRHGHLQFNFGIGRSDHGASTQRKPM
jgi:hypothetical protein